MGTTGMRFNRPHPVPLRVPPDGTSVYQFLSQNGTPETGGPLRNNHLHVVQHFSKWNPSSSSGSLLSSNWLRQPLRWPILSSTTGCERRRWLLKGRGKNNAGDRWAKSWQDNPVEGKQTTDKCPAIWAEAESLKAQRYDRSALVKKKETNKKDRY